MYGGWTEYAVLWTIFLTFLRRIFTEFERKVYVQKPEFGWNDFKIGFLKLLNHDVKKCKQNSIVKLLVVKEQVKNIKINSYHRK